MSDLKNIKETLEVFLMLEPVQNEHLPFIVHHPFISTVGDMGDDGNIYMIFDNDGKLNSDNLSKVRAAYRKWINHIKDASGVLMRVNTPYLLTVFQYIYPFLDDNDFAYLLRECWTRTERPSSDCNVKIADFIRFFKKADKKMLMEETDYLKFQELEDMVTVYRGVSGDYASRGISYTLDLDKAEYFATRWRDEGSIYTMQVPKKKILAYFDGRCESEVVVDIRGLHPTLLTTVKR